MVPKDQAYTNLTVTDTFVARKSIVTPLVIANRLQIDHDITLSENASIIIQNNANTNVVFTTGDQTIDGVKTFTAAPTFLSGVILGEGNTITLNAPTPAASRVYSLADVGSDASFVMTEGDQTINGAKTFGTSILLPTTGGIPTPLTFYQRITTTITFTSAALVIPRTTSCHLVRIGDTVTMTVRGFGGVGSGSPGTITGSAIPTQFRPVENVDIPIVVQENGELELAGFFHLATDGTSEMSRGVVTTVLGNDLLAARPFAGTALGILGCQGFTASWVAA